MNIRRARMRSAVTVALTSIFVAALCVAGGGIASATAEPTITLSGFPDSVIVDTAYTQFTLALHNPNAPVADTRIDVTITGTSDLQGSDVRLQYASELWSGAVLQGTADEPGGITGYFMFNGAPSGGPLASGVTSYLMRIGLVAGAPADTLRVRFALDVIDPATDEPATTLATQTAKLTVVARSTPTAPDLRLTVGAGSTTIFRVTSSNADGISPRFTNTDPDVGTVTDLGYAGATGNGSRATKVAERYAYSAPEDFAGTTSFTYTASDPGSEVTPFEDKPSSTGTVTVTVTAAATHLSAHLSPSTGTLGRKQTLSISVDTTGTLAPNLTVRIGGLKGTTTLKLDDDAAELTFTPTNVGSEPITIDYPGTASTAPATLKLTDSVKARTRLTAHVSPHNLSTSTRHPVVTIHVSTKAGSTTGGTVAVYRGSHRLAVARVEHDAARLVLPRQSAGTTTLTVRYRGTATTAPATKALRLMVRQP